MYPILFLIAITAIMVIMPVPGNVATRQRAEKAVAIQQLPRKPINLSGNVRLLVYNSDRVYPSRSAYSTESRSGKQAVVKDNRCGALCLSLLFTPGVSSVTVFLSGSSKKSGLFHERPAFTYRRIPAGGCSKIDKWGSDYAGRVAYGLELSAYNRAVDPTSDCILSEDALNKFDYTISIKNFMTHGPSSAGANIDTNLSARSVYVNSMQINDHAGRPLLRVAGANYTIIVQPAFPFVNLAVGGPRIGWAAYAETAPRGRPPTTALLSTYTNVEDRRFKNGRWIRLKDVM